MTLQGGNRGYRHYLRRRSDSEMDPVIGLDVANKVSQGQAFLAKGKPYGKNFEIIHNREGLDTVLHFLKEVEAKTDQQPTVILESTGHYHAPVIEFLEEQNYVYIIVNPIISYQAKNRVYERSKRMP